MRAETITGKYLSQSLVISFSREGTRILEWEKPIIRFSICINKGKLSQNKLQFLLKNMLQFNFLKKNKYSNKIMAVIFEHFDMEYEICFNFY